MTKFKLDAIVAPTQGPAGLIDLVNGDAGGRRLLHSAGGGCRLSARHGTDGNGARPAGRSVVRRTGVE